MAGRGFGTKHNNMSRNFSCRVQEGSLCKQVFFNVCSFQYFSEKASKFLYQRYACIVENGGLVVLSSLQTLLVRLRNKN